MGRWIYTLTMGKALRQAIDDEDAQLVVGCLVACYRELYSKLSDEDKEWKGMDIEDAIETLTFYVVDPDDEDDVDYYLDEFYDICDNLRAWVAM